MEVISKEPLIIIDGAHNPGAVLELRKTLDLYFTNKRITFIMGCCLIKIFQGSRNYCGQGRKNYYDNAKQFTRFRRAQACRNFGEI